MTSLLSRLAVGGALVAALGTAIAPIAVAKTAPAAVNCADGNSMKNVLVSADSAKVGVVFNFNCSLVGKVRSVGYLPRGEKPTPNVGEGTVAVKGKAFIKVVTEGNDVDSYDRFLKKPIAGEGAVEQVVYAGGHAGQTTWYIGVTDRHKFTWKATGKTLNVDVTPGK
ncbi:hypothetical protein NLX83_07800 [Allokutzneria sp. A3M-2-11 16]|uniref:AMIN-like domain-containing (lipo)protein n=1 Tax=Allokutzneria sp. A3M-2-11 16 TaxID=2962043 RepID=UPI0020B88F1A|nr:hypothetical protein [Allokutzneria sp. A3M-2-11 16]MCP3799156.1 hypothetical protein [Allokutzneria sp. A3M-2-11 16]